MPMIAHTYKVFMVCFSVLSLEKLVKTFTGSPIGRGHFTGP